MSALSIIIRIPLAALCEPFGVRSRLRRTPGEHLAESNRDQRHHQVRHLHDPVVLSRQDTLLRHANDRQRHAHDNRRKQLADTSLIQRLAISLPWPSPVR